jgi:uridine kinase
MSDHVYGPNGADPAHARRVAGMAYDAAERVRDRPVVVAIDGPAASGKSTLAALLVPLLGDAPVVHLDDLYPGGDGLAAGNHRLVTQVLQPMHGGRPASYRRFDWNTGELAETRAVPVRRFLVVEGCGSSAREAAGLVDVRVWVEAAEQLRRERGEARTAGGFAGHWDHWAAPERELFGADRTRERADLVVETR